MGSIRSIAPVMLMLLAACGGPAMVSDEPPGASPYDGPMKLAIVGDEDGPVLQRSGAAGLALECNSAAYDGGGGDYDGGLASTQDTAEAALENSFSEDGHGLSLPASGYRVERRDEDRVLLSYDVNEQTKIAFIAFNGIVDFDGERGWGIESWAQCDPSEFDPDAADDLGIGVWADASGHKVPVATLQSFAGAEHCDWQDINFIQLAHGADELEFVRDTRGVLAELLVGKFDDSGQLPDTAINTGFYRAGRELWLATDLEAAFLVDVDDSSNVEVWPASKSRIGCA